MKKPTIVKHWTLADGKVNARFTSDDQSDAYIAKAMKAGAEQHGFYLRHQDGRIEWVDWSHACDVTCQPHQEIHTDLAKARAALDELGGVLLCEAGTFKVCCCVADYSKRLRFPCLCRPAGYVESLAPSFDESRPENLCRRPMEDAQADLFGE